MTTGNNQSNNILTDTYGRTITNVRIALTNACNLRCIYCHHEGEESSGCTVCNQHIQMTKDEITEIIRVFAELGVTFIKFTGGEPTLRSDLIEIIQSIPSHIESSMTTNGTLLEKMASDLMAAGLSRVNISLDTLRRERYLKITGHDLLHDVLAGIEAALSADLTPIKLNMVLLKGINDDEIDDFLSYVRGKNNLILQIIELMNINGWGDRIDYVKKDAVENLEKDIASRSTKITTRRMQHRRKYWVDGAEVEVVRPLHNLEFCANCNRLRVTSDGKLKPCLLRTGNEVNIRGLHGDALKAAIAQTVQNRSPYFF
ncbi:MAG TPA: GTP 3',8-cyclase MoaA [Methanocorpusculum sp.]|nr:GTP 3',8-cyclase MoaA [Methanocorpusculum sp.]